MRVRYPRADMRPIRLALLCFALAACAGGEKDPDAPGRDASTSDDAGDLDAGVDAGRDANVNPGLFAIVPSEGVIRVVNGVSESLTLEAHLDGEIVSASWAVDDSLRAAVDDGVVTGAGSRAGPVVVTASYLGQEATAAVDVRLEWVENPLGIDDASMDALRAAADPDPAVQIAYPYDGTVFPRRLAPPLVMWNGGSPGDTYLVAIEGDFVRFEAFSRVPPPSRFEIPPATWESLTEDDPGSALTLTISRDSGAAVTRISPQTWTIAPAELTGRIFYTSPPGRVTRLDVGADAPVDFLADAGQDGCVECHSASSDGSTLVLGGDTAGSTWDVAGNWTVLDITTVGKGLREWGLAALTPDGRFLVENNAPLSGPPGGSDGMFDTATGALLAGTGLDGIRIDMPSISADGSLLAFIDHTTKALVTWAFDPDVPEVVGEPIDLDLPIVVDGFSWPAASHDGEWVAYVRGSSVSFDSRFGPGSLFLADAIDPGAIARLREANGDDYPFVAGDRDRDCNYRPYFAPYAAGGYRWLIFTSRRTYGNLLTGDATLVKQLWVAALDESPDVDGDPSHAAFWLPGQDTEVLNHQAAWTE